MINQKKSTKMFTLASRSVRISDLTETHGNFSRASMIFTGIGVGPSIRGNAKFMIGTMMSYVIVQVAYFMSEGGM
jgi:hypothetical protein